MARKQMVAVGVDLGGTTFEVGIVTPQGELVQRQAYDTPRSSSEPQALIAVAAAVGGIMEQAAVKPDQLLGIGLGIPGPVDPDSGVITQAPNMHELDGVNAVETIAGELDMGDDAQVKVRIGNDAYCHTLAELRYGAARDVENLVMLTLGTGVGGGVALDNQVRRGPRQIMGEVGHIVVEPNGRRCGCGNHGCLEAIVGRDGLIDQAVRLLEQGMPSVLAERGGCNHERLSPKMIAEAADGGDELALQVMRTSGHYIGVALCSCIVLTDPDLIVLGGGIANAGNVLFEPIRRTVRHRSQISCFDTDRIVPSELGGEAGVLGAAALILDEVG